MDAATGSEPATPCVDGGPEDAGAFPRSCRGLPETCGPSGNESCCASPLVTGGTFFRSYDGVTVKDPNSSSSPRVDYQSKASPATVSDFRLDRYEVTIGRFRKFVEAWRCGFRPAAGAGKHAHLNGGSGLSDSSGTSAFETGWDPAWAANVTLTDQSLRCDLEHDAAWSRLPGVHENRPVSCSNWWEAVAFCTWDGGFLPSEAEWNYAASGGSEQRVFPWSKPPSSTTIDCTYANYLGASGGTDFCVLPGTGATNDVGSESPKGDGRYRQADLAGNEGEWTLDAWEYYVLPCNDCSYLTSDPNSVRAVRGGNFNDGSTGASLLLSSSRYSSGYDPSMRMGFRCARAP